MYLNVCMIVYLRYCLLFKVSFVKFTSIPSIIVLCRHKCCLSHRLANLRTLSSPSIFYYRFSVQPYSCHIYLQFLLLKYVLHADLHEIIIQLELLAESRECDANLLFTAYLLLLHRHNILGVAKM